jgi:serine/threonine protein kinase
MPIATVADFVNALRPLPLLSAAQLDDLAAQARFPDAETLTRELVQRGWLTPFQVEQLLQDRGSHLALGPYVLLECLGEGGMGQVFKARHQLMERVVAVKLIRKERLADGQAVARFLREIKVVSQLSHPNIVTAHDAAQVGDTLLLAMEFVDGTDLARLVRESGPLPVPRACHYIRQAALGLQHAHERGLVHRDIKPHNLLVTQTGPAMEGTVKILDMGLARLQQSGAGVAASLTHEGTVMGTPHYMAPEQARDSRQVDTRSDIYSLGCTLYHLLTGRPPFAGETFAEILIKHLEDEPEPVANLRPDVPADVEAVLRRMMAKRVEERYQAPAEVAEALAARAGQSPGKQPRPADPLASDQLSTVAASTWSPALPRRRHYLRWLALLFVVVGLAVAAILAGPALQQPPTPTSATQPICDDPLGEIRQMTGHDGAVWSVAFAPDQLRGLSGGDDHSVRLWDLQSGREVRSFSGHQGAVNCVAFTPNGSVALSASDDGTVRVWETGSGKELRHFDDHKATAQAVLAFPDNRRVASAGGDKLIRIWELDTAKEIARCEGHTDLVRCLALSSDGTLLASGSDDQTVRLWDARTQKELHVLKGHTTGVVAVAVSSDGRRILSGSFDGAVRLWDAASGKELWKEQTTRLRDGLPEQPLFGVTFVGKGAQALTGGKELQLWDTATGTVVPAFQTAAVRSVAASLDGRQALTGGGDGVLRLWGLPRP